MTTIKCPHCNYQYLPGEIFDPKHFLGQPTRIIRDEDGEVLGHKGIEMDTTESFTCYNCDKDFLVKARISFVTYKDDVQLIDEPQIKIEEANLF